MQTADWKKRYYAMTRVAAETAERLARKEYGVPLYVAVKPANAGQWGELAIIRQGQDLPPGFRLLAGLPSDKPFSTWPDVIRSHNPPVIGD